MVPAPWTLTVTYHLHARTILVLLSTLAAPVVAACTQPAADSDAAPQVAELNGSAPPIDLETIAGPEWARCWVEATGGVADAQDIVCSSTFSAKNSFAIAKLSAVLGQGATHLATLLLATSSGSTASQSHGVLPAQFPITVTLTVSPNYEKDDMGIAAENGDLTAALTIASPAGATKDHPIVFRQPFAMWPVAIVARPRTGDDFFGYDISACDVPSTPFTTGAPAHPSKLHVAPDFATIPVPNDHHVSRANLVAPASGSLAVRFMLSGGSPLGPVELAQDAIIDGPGIYIAEPTGLRRATSSDVLPEELLATEGPATPPPATPAQPNAGNGGPCDESRRPASDPDATACGGDGERCCNPIPGCQNSGKCAGDSSCIGTQCFAF
jgi:hypothetical protein